MLRNYLTIAWRNLLRHKIFSLINILGLAVGMAAGLLILHYATFELSYDDFHRLGKDIYRVNLQHTASDEVPHHFATSYCPLGPALKQAYPEVKDFARIYYASGKSLLNVGNRAFNEQLVFADSSFLHLFSYSLLMGDVKTALAQPNTIVITESLAKKYFGEQNPMGKFIRVREGTLDITLQVTGLLQNLPPNTHLSFDLLISFIAFDHRLAPWSQQNWAWKVFYTYIQLRPQASPQALEAKFPEIVAKYNGEYLRRVHAREAFFMQPLRDIHLHSDLIREAGVNGNGQLVNFLLAIACFIIVIAWVNYINLSTAKAIERAKEISVRKVTGATRLQLIRQFLLESLLINLVSTVIALILVQLVLPSFGTLVGKYIPASFTAISWLALLIIFLLGILATGLYPAFVLSSFQPVIVLKGKFRSSIKGALLRKGLVVGQFAASVMLITGTFTVYRQIQFMRKADLGMSLEQTLVVEAPVVIPDYSTYPVNLHTFRNEVAAVPTVKGFTATDFIPGQSVMESWSGYIRRVNSNPTDARTYNLTGIDYDFIPTLQLQLLAGRNFSPSFPTDSAAVILTGEAARQLGFRAPQEAIGQMILYPLRGENNQPIQIIGVVRDFHFQSLKNTFAPIIFNLSEWNRSYYLTKVSTTDLPKTLANLKARYETHFPDNPFAYFFLDERFNQQYQTDLAFGKIFGFFTGLAILIACLGLFGLSLFATTQRTKEIGVRKVLGATISSILILLSKDFLKLVFLANLVAWPLAYWGIRQWLQNYAFRIGIRWWMFGIPGLLIALLTVSFQTWKAARANPVKALRYE